MKALFSFLCLFLCVASFGQSKSVDKTKILGTWVSAEDKNYTMVFKGDGVAEYYEKEKTSESTYKISGASLTKTDKADKSTYKYTILTLTDKALTLLYLDRGNTLKFRRKAK
jgi:hypothetical protein